MASTIPTVCLSKASMQTLRTKGGTLHMCVSNTPDKINSYHCARIVYQVKNFNTWIDFPNALGAATLLQSLQLKAGTTHKLFARIARLSIQNP